MGSRAQTTDLVARRKMLTETDKKYDRLELRNRTVVETLSPVSDFGNQEKKREEDEEFDTLHLRNRVVTETLSPVADLGEDKDKQTEKKEETNSPDKRDEEKDRDEEKSQYGCCPWLSCL